MLTFHLENRVTVNECTVPQYWGINYQTANSSNAAPPSIGADMSIKLDSDDFCSTLTTIGTAVAGKFTRSVMNQVLQSAHVSV